MKIVYILDTLARVGGVERIMADKMNWLVANGHEVTLITAAQGQHPHSFRLSDNVRHVDIDARFHVQYRYGYPMRLWVRWRMNRCFQRNLSREISAIDPDVIIATTYYKADVVCSLRCRAAKIVESHCARSFTGRRDGVTRGRVVQWFHDFFLDRYIRRIEQRADVVVALTDGDAREWSKARSVCVIPNVYNNVCTVPACRGFKRVIAAGRLVYQKGFDMLIEAWRTVAERHPDWTLDIFGAGEKEIELKRRIDGLALSGSISIKGPTKRIIEEFSGSDVFVLSSRSEGFGLVLIEAMSCGTPCVSFDCPYGPADIIRDHEDGILVENGNVQRLAEAIIYLIEHEEERRAYGLRAAENVKRFLPDRVMPRWVALFEGLLK